MRKPSKAKNRRELSSSDFEALIKRATPQPKRACFFQALPEDVQEAISHLGELSNKGQCFRMDQVSQWVYEQCGTQIGGGTIRKHMRGGCSCRDETEENG